MSRYTKLGVATITITVNGENGHTNKYEIHDLGNARYIETMVSRLVRSEQRQQESNPARHPQW